MSPLMSTPSKPRGRRYSREAQQEDLSEAQFKERLAALGWPANRLGRDLGEDLLVQIYDQGASSGLSFYVQLKSVRDAERRRPKGAPEELRYRLEVKDLLHWEVQAIPVVLVIWDVEQRQGYWDAIANLIGPLDKADKGWRQQKRVTAAISTEHGTDERGLRLLRRAVADRTMALLSGRTSSTITLSFPATDHGRQSLLKLEHALDRGERVVFDGDELPRVKMPDWYRRLYGEQGQLTRLELKPTLPQESLPVRIDIASPSGSAGVPYVDLRAIKHGRRSVVFNNERQGLPFVFELAIVDAGDCTMQMTQVRFGRTVREALEATALTVALSRPGSRIVISEAKSGEVLFSGPVPVALAGVGTWASARLDVLEKLSYIEPRIVRFGTVSLDRGIGPDDVAAVELLYQICRAGRRRKVGIDPFYVPPGITGSSASSIMDGDFQWNDAKTRLLGVVITLGRVKITAEDPERFASAVSKAVAQARATGLPVLVSLDDLPVTEEFLDWPRPADRIFDIASAQSGYFTLAQAAQAGFASVEQVEIELRVERYGADVFRFVQFPPSDHEDLVILWLQTEQKGVFSHDTALALHQLSDILPSRRHLTVPPGWEPPPNVRLDRGTVLHHAEIAPDEITWLTPIPLTKPLRTLRDCIEKAVSPDLIDQAIAEAVQRGMITQADAQTLATLRARSV